MDSIDAGGTMLSYERAGSGEPLLLIMGMSGTALHWGEPLLEDLRRDHDVIVYDHRGVGASARLDGELSIAQLARDAAALLDGLEIPSANVLGISMGGMVAQELALARPELIRALTLGCTYARRAEFTFPEVQSRLAEAMMSGDRELAVRAAWESNVSPQAAADEASWARFREVADLRPVALPVIQAQLLACMAHDSRERLSGIRAPTLVIHGSEDRIISAEGGRELARLIPEARLEILEGAGHLFFWERPQESAALVRAHAAALL